MTRTAVEPKIDGYAALRNKGPLVFQKLLWPDVKFYDKQIEIVQSVVRNKKTVVPAGMKLGKDFISAYVVLWFYLTRNPCRVITTSVAEHHLTVLWDEMDRFIKMSRVPLTVDAGGPLIVKHRQIYKVIDGVEDPISYIWGMVAEKEAKMSGHHATPASGAEMDRWIRDGRPPLTLFVVDEASGVEDSYHKMASAWASRMLIIGNPWPCSTFFFKDVMGDRAASDPAMRAGGDVYSPTGECLRKIIRITVEDSPNVKLARQQMAEGIQPTNKIVVPGIKTWSEYQDELITWDEHSKSVGHRAEFYEGGEIKLFPSSWLDHAELVAEGVDECPVCGRSHPKLSRNRPAAALGVDSAQGGDNTSMAAADDDGLIDLRSFKTPDTSVIPGETLGFMVLHGVPPEKVMFDYGGGGKQHVDVLRSRGYNVQAVAFGESATPPPRRVMGTIEQRSKEREERYAYVNRRAEMHGMLSLRLDPMADRPFGLPRDLLNAPRADGGPSLRQQLQAIPKMYDGEGRLFLPPKNKRGGAKDKSRKESLTDIIGCSPDEADSVVLAVFGLVQRSPKFSVKTVT